jgi:hypothetical protein
MTDLRELLEQAADGPAPASGLAADELFAAGRRRHRRRRIVAGAAAAAAVLGIVAALSATSLLTAQPRREEPPADRQTSVVRQEPRPGVHGPGAIIQWAGAADAEHIYLAYLHCAGSPCRKDSFDLVGSDDGGRTWSDRATNLPAYDWQVVGARTLLVTNVSATERLVSVDGGRTWSSLTTGSPTEAVPDGGALVCDSPQHQAACRLYVVDPGAGRLAPLSAQPPLKLSQPASIVDANGRLWVTATDRASGRPAVAFSLDRGRTWSTHVFDDLAPCTAQSCPAPTLATADGRTVYVTIPDPAQRERVAYRSTGGRSWSRLGTGNVPYGQGTGWSYVAADGSHVICAMSERGRKADECQFRAAKGGAGYQRTRLNGLPTSVGDVGRAADGWYYAVSYAPTSTLYGSRDGLDWSPLTGG